MVFLSTSKKRAKREKSGKMPEAELFWPVRALLQPLVPLRSLTALLRPETALRRPMTAPWLVQNRSDFEPGLCFIIGRSMNEDFLWWVGEK